MSVLKNNQNNSNNQIKQTENNNKEKQQEKEVDKSQPKELKLDQQQQQHGGIIYLPSSTFKDKQKQIQSSKDKDDQLIKDVVKPPNKEFLKIFGDIREKKDQKRDKKQNTPSQKAPKPDVGQKQSTFKDPKYDYNVDQDDY
ncbi:MAG: hypothetical protein EZS28_052531 [Streblomastix strix]|uniref:Uncharacterized protein n=1 Tax=Streblomastix strix TaxID=222440 RepID=A0A5J4S519_9EUKA|nr:MAG: hypothetical protein EZS28_052531 [Streblomastix strix]